MRRALHHIWVESILHQCRNAKAPFFFKQWGGTQKKRRGRLLLGRTYNVFPVRVHIDTQEGSQLSLRLL
jgi:protein gp37